MYHPAPKHTATPVQQQAMYHPAPKHTATPVQQQAMYHPAPKHTATPVQQKAVPVGDYRKGKPTDSAGRDLD